MAVQLITLWLWLGSQISVNGWCTGGGNVSVIQTERLSVSSDDDGDESNNFAVVGVEKDENQSAEFPPTCVPTADFQVTRLADLGAKQRKKFVPRLCVAGKFSISCGQKVIVDTFAGTNAYGPVEMVPLKNTRPPKLSPVDSSSSRDRACICPTVGTSMLWTAKVSVEEMSSGKDKMEEEENSAF
ncbi:hypothetical protein BDD12DRAFT_800661 [Trichophaea hybrida]|nr:hypothetical protein BDD12DRAFT_800661 [Trichophaea hybrida]